MTQLAGKAMPREVCAREGVANGGRHFDLQHGGSIEKVRVAYRLIGPEGAPLIAALGGISAGRCVAAEDAGWWSELVGAGRGIDLERYRVLGMDFIGGSGHSSPIPPGASVSSLDQARALAVVLDSLAETSLHGIAGASYGGMIALAFAQLFPERVERIAVCSAAHRAHPQATAWRSIQRAVVRESIERGAGAQGLKLARALAMVTYRSAAEFDQRFDSPPAFKRGRFEFPVEEYLFSRGDAYVKVHRPETFVSLSESIDLHRVDPARITVPTSLIAIEQDQIVPLADMRALHAQLRGPRELFVVSSIYGHDAFLKDGGQLNPLLDEIFSKGRT